MTGDCPPGTRTVVPGSLYEQLFNDLADRLFTLDQARTDLVDLSLAANLENPDRVTVTICGWWEHPDADTEDTATITVHRSRAGTWLATCREIPAVRGCAATTADLADQIIESFARNAPTPAAAP